MKHYLKYLYALAIVTNLIGAEAYYDDRPTIQRVFSVKIHEDIPWFQPRNGTRVEEAFEGLEEALEDLDFTIESISYTPTRHDDIDATTLLLTKKNNRDQFQYCVFIHMEYKTRSRTLNSRNPARHNTRFDEDEYCHVLSWRYTDQMLHKMLERYGQFGEEITDHIDRKGFFNSIIRIGIVANEDHTYNFYHAFTSAQEEAMGLRVLERLKRYYQRMGLPIY